MRRGEWYIVVRGSGVRRVGKGGLEFNISIANLYSCNTVCVLVR